MHPFMVHSLAPDPQQALGKAPAPNDLGMGPICSSPCGDLPEAAPKVGLIDVGAPIPLMLGTSMMASRLAGELQATWRRRLRSARAQQSRSEL